MNNPIKISLIVDEIRLEEILSWLQEYCMKYSFYVGNEAEQYYMWLIPSDGFSRLILEVSFQDVEEASLFKLTW